MLSIRNKIKAIAEAAKSKVPANYFAGLVAGIGGIIITLVIVGVIVVNVLNQTNLSGSSFDVQALLLDNWMNLVFLGIGLSLMVMAFIPTLQYFGISIGGGSGRRGK